METPGRPPIFRQVLKGRDILLLLDFDGTLSPIASSPDQARLPRDAGKVLKALASRPRVKLAILSGRALGDVRRRVGIPSAYYSGNHGLEIKGPGLSFLHPSAKLSRGDLKALAALARRAFAKIPGALVEYKGLGVALHGRRVAPANRTAFLSAVEWLQGSVPGRKLLWRRGLEVWEALPRVSWNKGRAAALLVDRLGGPFPIAIGDDLTDEDLFAAVNGLGLTIHVGAGGASRAFFSVDGPGEVRRFLESLEECL
jgi:trehalose 6-phosphate phosphatase